MASDAANLFRNCEAPLPHAFAACSRQLARTSPTLAAPKTNHACKTANTAILQHVYIDQRYQNNQQRLRYGSPKCLNLSNAYKMQMRTNPIRA